MIYKRVMVPEFEIFSNPTISIAGITSRRFNVIDRAKEESVDDILEAMRKLTPLCGESSDGIISKSKNVEMRKFIIKYIKERKVFDNLRSAIKIHCPEQEDTLNKLLVLK